MQNVALVGLLGCLAASQVAAQQCTTKLITCNSHISDRLENSHCFFSTGGIYASYYFTAVAGEHLDVFMRTNSFEPQLFLYTPAGGYPIAVGDPAITIVELQYDIPTSGTYYLAATSNNQTAGTGAYAIDFYCSVFCSPAVILSTPTASSYSVEPGARVIVTANADGTPPLAYAWFDDNDPLSVIGNTASMTTPPLFKSTRFHVNVINSCGSIDGYTQTIQVQPCSQPVIAAQPQDVVVAAGSNASFLVGIAATTQQIAFQWYSGSVGDTSHLLSTSNPFTITNVQQSGTFWVRVRNACGGFADSRAASVTVITPRRRAARH